MIPHINLVVVIHHDEANTATHRSYHGHPVACAAAYAVQQVIKENNLIENCREVGGYLGKLLQERLGSHKNVGDIRGRGLVWGVSGLTGLHCCCHRMRLIGNAQIELVHDKSTKQPFPVAEKVAPTIQATGLRKEFSISFIPGGGVADVSIFVTGFGTGERTQRSTC